MTDHDIDRIVALLEKHAQRATYGAVAGLVGRIAGSLMQGRDKSPRNSWVVSSKTGLPTGYAPTQMHPRLESKSTVLDSSEELAAWIRAQSRAELDVGRKRIRGHSTD